MAPRMAVSPLWRDCHRGRGNHGSRIGALPADHRPYALTSDFNLTTACVPRGVQTMSFVEKRRVQIQRHEVADEIVSHLQTFEMNLGRSEEHTSELQSLMRISYAVFCLKKK